MKLYSFLGAVRKGYHPLSPTTGDNHITDTGGDLALNGKNDYAYTAGIPQALADALEKYHDDDDYIDDVQLTEDGEWLILVGKNGCQ